MNQTVFIIDVYNRFAPPEIQDMVRFRFLLNDIWYAIYECSLEWGKPKFPYRPIDEEQLPNFFLFNTIEEALDFVKTMKKINQ